MARATKTATDVRREQIAEAAMEMIGARGLVSLSIAGVADRVGIAPSGVYRHYAGKEEILDAVVSLLRTQMLAHVDIVREETPAALSRLNSLLVRQMDLLINNPAFIHVVFAHFAQADHTDRWTVLRETICAYVQEVAAIVEEGQQEGVIRKDIIPRSAAVMYLGLILPAAMLHRLSDGDFDPTEHVRAVWPMFERSLTGR